MLISTAKTFYHPQRRRSVNIIIVNDLFPRIKFDTNTPFESAVAPRSNLTELGSAHEWSGVWNGPHLSTFSTYLRPVILHYVSII